MIQIVIRNLSQKTYEQLKMLANKNKTSINKTIIALLHKSLGIDDTTKKIRDLSDIAGKWSEDEFNEFMTNIKVLDAIDEEVWK
ncbi:MAG: hypothetical protein AB1444_05760 [Spirochaetota bacterium]